MTSIASLSACVHFNNDLFFIAVYGSVCGASVLVISTVVCVVCVIVCIKHKYKGTVSLFWHCMK